MWKRFMKEAHAYLQLPPKPFEKPADVVTGSCGGREEVFKADAQLTKPGACKAPPPKPSPGGPTAVPTAKPPSFPPRNTATPTPTPEPTSTPPPTPEPAPTPEPIIYIVEPGDTLSGIAVKFDITLQALLDANNLKADAKIKPGDELIIPVAANTT
jgi:nucleoid-associated protein YgaU